MLNCCKQLALIAGRARHEVGTDRGDKSYYNIRDPKEIQRHADSEVPPEKVYGDWPVSTDP
jgi:hypothetical protein